MSDALFAAMTALAADDAVRVIVVTGGAPGYSCGTIRSLP